MVPVLGRSQLCKTLSKGGFPVPDKVAIQTQLLTSFPKINIGESTEALGFTDRKYQHKNQVTPGKAVMNQQGQVYSGAMREQAEGALNSVLISTWHCHRRSQKPAAVACSCGTMSAQSTAGRELERTREVD